MISRKNSANDQKNPFADIYFFLRILTIFNESVTLIETQVSVDAESQLHCTTMTMLQSTSQRRRSSATYGFKHAKKRSIISHNFDF